MQNIKARIARRLLLFEKFHEVIIKERQVLKAGDVSRLPLIGAKKTRIMKAVDAQPLGGVLEAKQDEESGRMLALLEEKVRSVMKDAAENQRLLQEQLNAVTHELRSMKKDSRIRSAYRQPRASSSIFIDDKK